MRHKIITTTAAILCLSATSMANATDLISNDTETRMVTITTDEGSKTVELPSMGEVLGVCEGCVVSLDDGQSVTANPDDTVSVIEGTLLINE